MVPEVGSVIGERYALVSLLDQGGMGAVWMARDIVSDARVALKILSCSVSNRSGLRRFCRETDALARLDDPNIVRIVGHGVDRNLPFIAMELLEGETLRSLLQRRGALPPQQVVDIVNQVASG